MDDITMKLGLLMEAAQTHQRSAELALKKLKATANDLADTVREEFRHFVVLEFQSLATDSNRAADAFRNVQRAANVRALAWSIGITTLCSAIPLLLTCWLLPSRSEISALRAKH